MIMKVEMKLIQMPNYILPSNPGRQLLRRQNATSLKHKMKDYKSKHLHAELPGGSEVLLENTAKCSARRRGPSMAWAIY